LTQPHTPQQRQQQQRRQQVQVSTLASWSTIAYVSWFGCDNYLGTSPYGDNARSLFNSNSNSNEQQDNEQNQQQGGSEYEPSSRIITQVGTFEGFQCPQHIGGEPGSGGQPLLTYLFFAFYILITSWVIMSLFIGVISMGMFDAFEQVTGSVGWSCWWWW